MKKEEFHGLIGKYVAGTASEAEMRLLEAYYARLTERYDPLPVDQEEILRKEMLERIMEKAGIPQMRVVRMRHRILKYGAAAAILLGVCVGGYWLLLNKSQLAVMQVQAGRFKNDVQPGGNKATLTLSSGSVIDLDSARHGALATQGSSQVIKLNDSVLTYASGTKSAEAVAYNTLATPKGGQYLLVLPDGTKVWLNAASSITYPTAFAGQERKVAITGEAYFEVAKNEKLPFIVQKGEMTMQVLGTHFNVNTYEDEDAMKTTLLEGSVKILRGSNSSVLRPGQQAILGNNNGQIQVINDANIEEVMAWKNGLFHFNNSSLQDVMRQIARWYDVEIEYKGAIPTRQFGGEISRNSNASEVLKILELSKVHFQIDGRKIVVMP
jgi:transmembrane sensor